MLNVQVSEDNVNIEFNRNLINDQDLMEFIEKVKVKNLVSGSKLTQKDAIKLDRELKSNWWKKNREKFLSKTKT